jgi:hypothetical protein
MGQTVVRTVTDHFKAMVPAACGIRHFQEDARDEEKDYYAVVICLMAMAVDKSAYLSYGSKPLVDLDA